MDALLPVVARPGISKTAVLAAATQGQWADDIFEIDQRFLER